VELRICYQSFKRVRRPVDDFTSLGTIYYQKRWHYRTSSALAALLVSAYNWSAPVSKLIKRGRSSHLMLLMKLTSTTRALLLLGGPSIVMSLLLTRRLQLVNGRSSLEAGVMLVPSSLFIAVGAIVGAQVANRLQVPPIYTTILGSILQVVGSALLSTLPTSMEMPSSMNGYELIGGLVSWSELHGLVSDNPFRNRNSRSR
jgi:hypothetical protein